VKQIHLLFFFPAFLLFTQAAFAEGLACSFTRFLPTGEKETGKLEGKNNYTLKGENESENIRFGRGKSGHIVFEVKSEVDGKPYIEDLVSCDRFLDCSGVRRKFPKGKLKETPFTAAPSNYQGRLQIGDRLLFTFRRVDPGFVFTYINYPLVKGGFVGVEFGCAGY